MQTLNVFNNVSLDGYYCGLDGDMSWAHKRPDDSEWNAFVAGNAGGGGTLLFGRTTYEMMIGFWPTPVAAEMMPDVAAAMNSTRKVVFSRTMKSATWQNTAVASDLITTVQRLKAEEGSGLTILGSGAIVAQLAQARLVDQFQIAIAPVVLGSGKSMFTGVHPNLALQLADSRRFANGTVFQTYRMG